MADPKIRIKRSAVAGRIPSVDQVPLGELALNTWDGQLYASKNVGLGTTVVAVNPWLVGTGTDSYNTYFTAGNVGVGITNLASNTQVAIAGTLGISEVGENGTRTLISSGSAGFALDHNDNSPISFNVQGENKLTYINSTNSWTISSGGVGLVVGTSVTTGTTSQPLQVTGGAYVSGNLGIGTTLPSSKLHVVGDAYVSGVVTANAGFNLGISSAGSVITSGPIKTLNFIGAGNTFLVNGTTVDISIQGGGGGAEIGVQANDSVIGYAQTTLNFAGTGVTGVSIGTTTTITIEPGLVGAAKSVTSFTATAGQTTFNVNYSQGQENVFLNGVRLSESQYTATNGSTVVLTDAASDGDSVDIVVYLRGSDPNRNVEVTLLPPFNGITTAFTMYKGTTSYPFDPLDERQIVVSLGGVIQQPGVAYTVGTGSSIFFSAAPGAGVTCFITALYSNTVGVPTDAVKLNKQTYTPSGIQTTFTVTEGYSSGYLDVYRNGIRLVDGSDFTASNGTTFDLVTPATGGDVVDIIAYKTLNLQYSEFAGLSTNVDGGYGSLANLQVSGISTLGNVYIGIGGTDLLVEGNARVTGILTVGPGSITFDGVNNKITGITQSDAANINVSGISTLGNVYIGIGGTDLLVEGNARVTGILTIGESSLALAGAQDANTITIGSTERVRFFDDGRTLFGSSTDKGAFTDDQKRVGQYQFVSTNYLLGGFYRYSADGTQLTLGSARGTEASPSQLNNNDYGGILQFVGHTGTYFADMGSIRCKSEEALTNSGSGSEIIFATTGTGSTSVTENIFIRHNGSLECRGDANPSALFDRGSANTTNVNLNYNGTLRGQISASASHFQISASGTGSDIEFYTEGNVVGRWDGRSFEIADPSASGWNLSEADPGTTSARGRASVRTHPSCSGIQEILQIFLGTTEKLRITANGNITNANNSYGPLSDQKLKENIVDASSQWEDIKNITIRKFNFKAETGHETHTQIGVVAQELELVSPGLVEDQVDKEVVDVPVLDEDGNAVLDENGDVVMTQEERETGTVTKTVKSSVLYMKAVKALQEAMIRIESLEAQVTALQNSVGIAST